MKLTAARIAAAKAKAAEEEAKKAAAADEDMESSEEDDQNETEASEDDTDTDEDAPNPPVKKKPAAKKASGIVLSPRAAERQRIQAIMGSEAAEGREELAEHLAYETDMSAKSALAMLAKAPQATVQATETTQRADRGTFRDAMRATTQNDPKVANGKAKGGTTAHADMSDEDFASSVVGFAAKYGLAKA